MLGSGNGRAIQDLLQYAHETQHEKIIRALSISLALVMYGKEESAETLISQMTMVRKFKIAEWIIIFRIRIIL